VEGHYRKRMEPKRQADSMTTLCPLSGRLLKKWEPVSLPQLRLEMRLLEKDRIFV
jgi:hypothetical protein